MKRTASAGWTGGLRDGQGSVSTGSGTLSKVPYAFGMRFGEDAGTNPEELVAAAHAACFSMALSLFMANEGLTPQQIDTTATVSFDNVDGAWTVTSSHLETRVKSAGANVATFQKAAEGAKAGCPISRLLKTTITLDAKLV